MEYINIVLPFISAALGAILTFFGTRRKEVMTYSNDFINKLLEEMETMRKEQKSMARKLENLHEENVDLRKQIVVLESKLNSCGPIRDGETPPYDCRYACGNPPASFPKAS